MSKAANRTSPLRKIVDYEKEIISSGLDRDGDWMHDPVYKWVEVLECGHTVSPKVDIYGETIAVKRRCKKCAKEQIDAPTS